MKAYNKLKMHKKDKLYSSDLILSMNQRAVIINALISYVTDNADEKKVKVDTLEQLQYQHDFFNNNHY
jgi:hypothetical protein